jgi:ferric-dicitrate binding protein FerR (iron transport regulator)
MTNPTQFSDIESDPIHLAAAEWYVRLQSSEVSIEDTLAWQRWLNESPANSQAFARIEEVSHVLRTVPVPSAVSVRRFARDRYDASVPLKDWEEAHAPRHSWTAGSLAALCAILALIISFWRTSSPHEFMPKLRPVHLGAGEQTTAGSAGIDEPTRVQDPAAITAWQTGRLAFRQRPLGDVLEDVNRYAPKRIVLEGDDVGALMITGTVERANIAGWVKSLERAFDLRATEERDRIVIRSRQSAP